MGADTETCALDRAVTAASQAAAALGLPGPSALLLMATGTSRIERELDEAVAVELGDLDGVPPRWAAVRLVQGLAGDRSVWLLSDAPAPATPGEAPWTAAFPVWWAAAAGATAMVHASAGTGLDGDGAPPPGSLAVLRDHINLSGASPLTGLGPSRLGPLFPDQTRLHDPRLADLADERAAARGLALVPAVAACTVGPALSTPAELRWFHRAGAQVAVQTLAAPLIAAAHAGLPTLALCAVTDAVPTGGNLATLVQASAALAPDLDALVADVARGLGQLDTR